MFRRAPNAIRPPNRSATPPASRTTLGARCARSSSPDPYSAAKRDYRTLPRFKEIPTINKNNELESNGGRVQKTQIPQLFFLLFFFTSFPLSFSSMTTKHRTTCNPFTFQSIMTGRIGFVLHQSKLSMDDLSAYCVFQIQLLEDLLATGLPPIEASFVLRRIQALHVMLARYDARLVASCMTVRQSRVTLTRPSLEAFRFSLLLCSHLTDFSGTVLPPPPLCVV